MRLTPEREAKIRRFSAQWGGATEDMLIDLLDEIDAMRVELAAVVTGNAANINWRPAVAKTETVAALPECAGCASDLREALDEVRKWLTNDEPSACDLIDSLWTIVEAPEVKRLRLRATAQQPELPEFVQEVVGLLDALDGMQSWDSGTAIGLHMATLRALLGGDECRSQMPRATAPPAAIVAAASSEDAKVLRNVAERYAGGMPVYADARQEALDALVDSIIVDPSTHVVLPRADVEEWIVGLRSYNDDVMFDYMPPALRELLGD
jgi:hypothetical protein